MPLWRERGTEVDHQPDDFARREVLPRGFVGEFRELANEFLEDQAHLRVRDDIGMEIDVHELFRDPIEQSRFVQAFDLGMELEPLYCLSKGLLKALMLHAPGFLTDQDLRFELRLRALSQSGFYRQQRFACQALDPEFATSREDFTRVLRQSIELADHCHRVNPAQADQIQETQQAIRQRITERLQGYMGSEWAWMGADLL